MQKLSNVIPILVLFNSIDRIVNIRENLKKLSTSFNQIVVVDNDLTGELEFYYQNISGVLYIHNANRGGLAGAYNTAIKYIENNEFDVEYLIFLDDDTKLNDINFDEYLKRLIYIQRQNGAVAVTGRYRDVNSETYCNFVKLNTWFHKKVISYGQPVQVTFIINSMSLWSYKDIINLGRFNEELMVDHVDSEMCLRASEMGYKILVDYSLVFNHEIGKRIKYNLFGYKLNSGNHGIMRRFLIGRGTAYMLRSRFLSWPAVSLFMAERVVYEILGIIISEQNKSLKLKALIKGFFCGITIDYNKIKDSGK